MRWKIYFTLLLTFQFIVGMFGAYSVAKKAMTEDVELTEKVFGTDNMMQESAKC